MRNPSKVLYMVLTTKIQDLNKQCLWISERIEKCAGFLLQNAHRACGLDWLGRPTAPRLGHCLLAGPPAALGHRRPRWAGRSPARWVVRAWAAHYACPPAWRPRRWTKPTRSLARLVALAFNFSNKQLIQFRNKNCKINIHLCSCPKIMKPVLLVS